jgi:hypothetical protein
MFLYFLCIVNGQDTFHVENFKLKNLHNIQYHFTWADRTDLPKVYLRLRP